MDTSRISFGEMVAGVSGLALFIFMFLPWYGASVDFEGVGSVSESANAWEALSFIDILLLIVALLAIGLAVARAMGAVPANLPAPPGTIVAAAGALAVLLVLFRILSIPGPDVEVDGVDFSRKIGVFLALLAAAGVAFGGWTAMNERASGQAPPDGTVGGTAGGPGGTPGAGPGGTPAA